MSETKHTAGPWHACCADTDAHYIFAPDGETVICKPWANDPEWKEFDVMQPILKRDEKLANARLIAASPELLEALIPFANYLTVMEAMGGTTPKSGPIWGCHSKAGDAEISVEDMKAARAAIAKATEKQP